MAESSTASSSSVPRKSRSPKVQTFSIATQAAKLQKVDIQINVEGVTIVDTKTKAILHRYPLQKISFCADDKQDKRIFSFIAKSQSDPEKHECYVFLSDKMAEQITLTVGEAFDLAYKVSELHLTSLFFALFWIPFLFCGVS
ncbi:phosphotyrosine interaction domain protein [Cooperia oncophora]